MTDDPLYNRLRELSWQRKLTSAEEAQLRGWLAVHPEAQADWESDAGLSELLNRLPDAPLPTNFTARVVRIVEGDAAATSRWRGSLWTGWLRWLPKAAVAVIVLGAGLLSYQQARLDYQRKDLAMSVEAVSEVASLPSPKILEDFDAIRALAPAPAADDELLALLK